MKKNAFFLMMVMIMISQMVAFGQKLNNKGAWFVFENQDYEITVDDIVEISMGVEKMVAWKSYHLSNGENFIPVNPQLWYEVMTELITEIDGIKPVNLANNLSSNGEIVSWDDNISGAVINYGLNQQGKQFIADANFKGTEGFRGLNYKGYLILKVSKPCLNPQRPKITTPIPNQKVVEEPKPDLGLSFDQKVALLDRKIEEANERLFVIQDETQPEPKPIIVNEVVTEVHKTWFRRNLPWLIPVGVAIIGGTVYALTKKGKSGPAIIEPRTMPPGLSAEPAPTGGLDSDPRGMPGGQGGG